MTRRVTRGAAGGLVVLTLAPAVGLSVQIVSVFVGRSFAPAVLTFVPLFTVVICWLLLLAWKTAQRRIPFTLLGAISAAVLTVLWWFALEDIRRDESDVLEAGEWWQEPFAAANLAVSLLTVGLCLLASVLIARRRSTPGTSIVLDRMRDAQVAARDE